MANKTYNLPQPRIMNKEQLEGMLLENLDPWQWDEKSGLREKQMTFYICNKVYSDVDFTSISYPACRKLALETLRVTHGTEEEEKNS